MHSTTKRRGTVGIACLCWLLAAAALAQERDSPAGLRLPPPTLPGAAAELHAGRPAEALASLERNARTTGTAPPALEHTILRATLLAAAGRGAEAESAWRSVIERAVFMRTFARRAIVESAAGRGAPADAEPFLAELTRGDPVRHRDLVLRVAEAYLTTGAPLRAAARYREVLAATGAGAAADAARLGLAAALEAAGDGARALATLREAQLRHRTSDAFVAGRREARRLARARGETLSPFSETEYRGLVRRLRNASRFEPALTLLDEWAAAFPGRASQERIAAERIETLYAQRDNEAAVAACVTFHDRFPSSPLVPAVRLTEFRLAVRMGDMDRARRLGTAIWEGRVPGATSEQRRGAGVLLAAVLVATGDVEGGLALFPGLFETAPTPDDQRAILWRAGVAAVRTGQYDRALTNLRGLIERGPGGTARPGGAVLAGRRSRAERRSGRRRACVRAARPALPLPLLRPDRAAAAGGDPRRARRRPGRPRPPRFPEPGAAPRVTRTGGVPCRHGAGPRRPHRRRGVVPAPPSGPQPGRPGPGPARGPRVFASRRPRECRAGALQPLHRVLQPAGARTAGRLPEDGLSPALLGHGRRSGPRPRRGSGAARLADAERVALRPRRPLGRRGRRTAADHAVHRRGARRAGRGRRRSWPAPSTTPGRRGAAAWPNPASTSPSRRA